MSRIQLIIAAVAAILLWPSIALAADGSPAPERLAGVVVTTIGIVLGVTRLLRASEDALHALLPERWRWVPAALLLALGGAATALPDVTDWWGYAVALLSAVGVLVVAATQGHQVRLTNPPEGKVAVVAPANSKSTGNPPIPPAAAMVFLIVALGTSGCAAVRPVIDGADSVCALAIAEHELVQDAAERYGWPLEQTASWLCGFPEVFDAWDAALMQRSADPADAAVAVARDWGLL